MPRLRLVLLAALVGVFALPAAPALAAAPANTTAPSISGKAASGWRLAADPGKWTTSSTPTYTYQWERCDSAGANCANIPGATSWEYGLTSSDVGSTIRVHVVATDSGGSTGLDSAATEVV